MSRKVAIFWPGDYRSKPNEWARPQFEQAHARLDAALRKLGREPYPVEGPLTRPDEAIDRLGSIDDPMIGLFVHWAYAPHTVDGVVGESNPLLLASNFSGTWPGLVALLNTAASLESVGRHASRIWSDAEDWTADAPFMDRLARWCDTGRIDHDDSELHDQCSVSGEAEQAAQRVLDGIRRRRVLALMLGDTSMGMINGYFGPRVLAPLGFSEHKVDQAWLVERVGLIPDRRVDDAFRFVRDRGVAFHWGEEDARDFTEDATREQLRGYLAVLDLMREFKADCLGWQYQLGLLKLLPPSDFAEGLFNSHARPEGDGSPLITATEADQGNLLPMELMKRLLEAKGLPGAVMFHDVRWGARHEGRFLWVLLNSGSCSAFAFNHDVDSLAGVHSYRQPGGYFPVPGGTFAGVSLPGKITWSRAWLDRHGQPVLDVGRGESVELPEDVRESWWRGTTRQWPFMAADLGCSMETIMAHYMSNHVAVAYGDIFGELIALGRALGFRVRVLSRGAPA
ncbi:fucose isomerase [Tautonia plasticadhaerens]|uniref:L-fucose isomerase n=1 Tax=Tautonia plasticadhaerens TaxID=2527974 RepID=A0A518H949_9BACT|nr:fucose isomerase [Tautonia plasticadhaerens]QDV37378.1 L-fucose isomerase [Tautonia plasticadhaerens]